MVKMRKTSKDIFDAEGFYGLSDWVKKATSAYETASDLVAKEFRHFLAGIELDKILKKALSGQEIEITARIRFKGDKKPKKTATKAAVVKQKLDD